MIAKFEIFPQVFHVILGWNFIQIYINKFKIFLIELKLKFIVNGRKQNLIFDIFPFEAFTGPFIGGTKIGWLALQENDFVDKGERWRFRFGYLVSFGAVFSCIPAALLRNKVGTNYAITFFGIPIIVGWILILCTHLQDANQEYLVVNLRFFF